MPSREIQVATRRKNPKISRDELKFATKFMYSLLVSPVIHNRTYIIVESKSLHHEYGLEGQSMCIDEENKYPRQFRIHLNADIPKKRQLLALAHELVHVKQFTKAELGKSFRVKNKTFTRWKKRLVDESKYHYYDWAWEVEAHGKEYGLYRRYKNFVKQHKVKFAPDTR